MQYTRPMIDLVYEIRRRVDAELKPSIKLANPDVLKELAAFYFRTRDTISKTLIKELLTQAGDEWLALLNPQKPEEASPTRQVVKVYRDQTMLVDVAPPSASAPAEPQPKVVRMYRGHPIV